MPDIADPARPRKRSRLRRWVPRLLVALLTLTVVVVVTTEIILRTTIPRQIVLAQVQNTLGLRVSAASLTTGWLGRTTLRDVQVSLPLSDRAFVTLPELRVRHTILPWLIATQSIDIYAIELDRPVVTVTQDRFGHWNVQDVAAILLKLGGQGQVQQTPNKSSPIVLPAVTLKDGTVDVTDNLDRHISLYPLNITGTPLSSLVWKYDVHLDPAAGGHVGLSGRVVTNDNFSHEVAFDLSNLAEMAKPWVPTFDPHAVVKGNWKGGLADGGVAGRLLLDQLRYGTAAARDGDFAVVARGGGITITPNSLVAQASDNLHTRLRIGGGSIHADGTAATIDQLDLQLLDGHVRIGGNFTYADLSGTLTADWNDLTLARGFNSTGGITAGIRPEWPDRHAVTIRASAGGSAAGAPYAADIRFAAAGKSLDDADATVTVPTLQYQWKSPVRLDGLVAHLASHPGKIDLTEVSMDRSGALSGAGAFKFDASHPSIGHYDWWLYLLGQRIPLPAIPNTPIHDQIAAFALNAWGNQQQISVSNSYAGVGDIIAMADGFYSFANPKPVDVNVSVSDVTAPVANSTAAPPSLVRGHIRGEAELTGNAYPLDLSLSGTLHARDLTVGDRPLQNVDVRCSGVLDRDHLAFDTEELKLLGGQWALHAKMPGRNHVPQATLQFHDLQLADVGDLLHEREMAGNADGTLDADAYDWTPGHVVIGGTFHAHGVRARQLSADDVTGNISLRENDLTIAPIHLRNGDGTADSTLRLSLSRPTLITASLNAAHWPVDAAAAHADVDAHAEHMLIDAAARTANGSVTFSADAAYQARPLATAHGAVDLAGQTATLTALEASALGGTATGTATFTLGFPLASSANFSWANLNLNALSPYEDRLRDANGSLSGTAVLAPTPGARAISPLLLQIDTAGTQTHIGPVVFSDAHLPIAIDTDRLILDGGRIDVADGSINLFARISRHVDDTLSAQVNATLGELDLDQIINEVEISSNAKPGTARSATEPATQNQKSAYPGRLNGRVNVVGDPRDIRTLFGTANLSLHDSDLANFGPFAALYNTMHLGGGPSKPNGTGEVDARYDNDNFIITNLHYFNRGTYAYGIARVSDVSRYPDSPISGTLAGTFRPLSNIKLPFFADADKIFSVLQSNLTTIVPGGTIRNPTYTPQSASELNSAMRTFLVGDAQAK